MIQVPLFVFLLLLVVVLCHALIERTDEDKLHIKALVLALMHKHLFYQHSQVCV